MLTCPCNFDPLTPLFYVVFEHLSREHIRTKVNHNLQISKLHVHCSLKRGNLELVLFCFVLIVG